jgi:hypothetical protein
MFDEFEVGIVDRLAKRRADTDGHSPVGQRHELHRIELDRGSRRCVRRGRGLHHLYTPSWNTDTPEGDAGRQDGWPLKTIHPAVKSSIGGCFFRKHRKSLSNADRRMSRLAGAGISFWQATLGV